MYPPNDTIVAVSSPSSDCRVIIRITGPQTLGILNEISSPPVEEKAGITSNSIAINAGINLDSIVYLFREPNSYTGDDLAELHLWSNESVTEAVLERLFALGLRPAEPGEFTARAYLNNKIDLAQAEAVNEVIAASNTMQLGAAQNLLSGKFGQARKNIRSSIIDYLGRLEARLDFSTEDIELPGEAELIGALDGTINRLRGLLAGSVRSESTLDLPAVGIAGAPNAGKSTLLNTLLGTKRSIVSHQRKTTRDVLTGDVELADCRCVLFDCAGLLAPNSVEGTMRAETILDELAQQATIGALKNAMVVAFCVDITKSDWAEDLAVWGVINHSRLIATATKTDLVAERDIAERISKLKSLFGCDFLPISAHSGTGIDKLTAVISERIIAATAGQGQLTLAESKYGIALTARHRQAIDAAIGEIEGAIKELKAGNDEVAAMNLRMAHSRLSDIEQHNIDEQLLDRIFSQFCIGK